MKLIVGLGNPGKKYLHTRHNVGRRVVEELASSLDSSFKLKKIDAAFLAEGQWKDNAVLIAYPDTFMNSSGESLCKLVKHYDVDPQENLLIVVDDIALSFGRLRLRSRGSDGGHNGLKSITQAIGSDGYARLRVGIAPPHPEDSKRAQTVADLSVPLEDFVLRSFEEFEEKQLPGVLSKAREACCLWMTESIEKAILAVNSDSI